MMKTCYKWQGDLSWLLSVPHTFLCSYYFQAPATQASQSQIYEK